MNKKGIPDEIECLKKELEKSKAQVLKYKSSLKDVRKELVRERKKKDVTTILLNKEQQQLLSNLFPNIDIQKLL